eukprot:TRINITY_DN13250_c0_g1_i1.p1 TRINITY_DN13250_c0_g1~~TRINITY_DN13250_c0_g1_i1.p1  ORF type:complete len:155 (+),score=18.47 TRINITY_DN13250_c0_g1_i1:621-1085(+)
MTDHNSHVLKIMQENVALQPEPYRSVVECRELEWANEAQTATLLADHPGGFDYILGTEVCYQQENIRPLLDTVYAVMSHRKRRRKEEGGDGESGGPQKCVFLLAYVARSETMGRLLAREAAEHTLVMKTLLTKPVYGGVNQGTLYQIELQCLDD